jgi:hypothetical protein
MKPIPEIECAPCRWALYALCSPILLLMLVTYSLTYVSWARRDRKACREQGHVWDLGPQGLKCLRCDWCGHDIL